MDIQALDRLARLRVQNGVALLDDTIPGWYHNILRVAHVDLYCGCFLVQATNTSTFHQALQKVDLTFEEAPEYGVLVRDGSQKEQILLYELLTYHWTDLTHRSLLRENCSSPWKVVIHDDIQDGEIIVTNSLENMFAERSLAA